MFNLSEEFSELSHDELQYIIDGYFLWAYNTMKQRGINIRSWKAWMGAHMKQRLIFSLGINFLLGFLSNLRFSGFLVT